MAAPYDGKLITHLGGGLAAARPAAPNTAPGILCIWYSTDTNAFSFWESGAGVWSADYVPVSTASSVTFTPAGDLAATDVQAALAELDTEKMPKAGGTFTGDIIVPDEAYDATAWNASLEVPTKNALRDIIESLVASIPGGYTTEEAQDAVGAMVDATLVYDDVTPALKRAPITGHVTIAAGSNAAALGSFTKAQLDTAVSDGNILYVGDVTQYTDELAQDAVAALLVAGTNVTLTYNDVANTLTIDAAGGGGGGGADTAYEVDTTALTGFTWVNQGSSSLQANANGSQSLISATDAGENIRGIFTATPGTPYEYLVGIIPNLGKDGFQMGGPTWRDSASGKIITMCMYQDNGSTTYWLPMNYNSPTSKNGNVAAINSYPFRGPTYFRIGDDGTNRYCKVGFDPYFQGVTIYDYARTSFATPDQIGLITNNVGTLGTTKLSLNIIHWERTI